MERVWTSTDGAVDVGPLDATDDLTLPSRAGALTALRAALEARGGPILLTGEPGVGKTWLRRRLQAESPATWRWVEVDVPPALGPNVLYCLIGHGLGLPIAGDSAVAGLNLADFLREASADGVRWALVLDEAQNASAAVLEEVRLLANRLGRPGGFSALVLVGQTALAHRLASRPSNALASRLALHVHLRSLDVEEARAFLKGMAATLAWDDRTLERHHRDHGGNPRRLLRAARAAIDGRPRLHDGREYSRVEPPRPLDQSPPPPAPDSPSTPDDTDPWDVSVLGPVKPPLRVGDGMVEVGWEPGPESEAMSEPTPATPPLPAPASASVPDAVSTLDPSPTRVAVAESLDGVENEPEPGPAPESIERVDDRYAALQAWLEWARNQGPDPAGKAGGDHPQGATGQSGIWVEGQQDFAPYSQLFSRLRQLRDVGESS